MANADSTIPAGRLSDGVRETGRSYRYRLVVAPVIGERWAAILVTSSAQRVDRMTSPGDGHTTLSTWASEFEDHVVGVSAVHAGEDRANVCEWAEGYAAAVRRFVSAECPVDVLEPLRGYDD